MLNNMRTVDDSIYAHCLNVALISRMIGRWLRFDSKELNTLTLAGLLHDIGKAMIPEEILNKPGSLTDEEFELIKSHTRLGYDVLKYQDIDLRIKNAALMHHERCDGSGYPSGLMDDEIEEFAMIIAIADVYDAMTAARSYRAPLCAFQVISNFERDGFQKYHTQYLLTFLKRIAATYQNNRVVLNDGRGCKIVMLNQNDLSRPIVQFDDKSCLDLSTNRNLYITAII
jgi:putative nucleotidyltransferase with HDIG domain